MTRTFPPARLDQTPPAAGLPRHRAIIAVDIEQSTSRPDPVKAELRRTLYDLFDQALRSAGIHRRDRDRFTDRGDGLLALIHPVDHAAKPILLNRAIPVLAQLLADYNASLPRAGRAHRQLRVRVVMHAGEVHYDGIDPHAFRLLIRVHVAGHRYPGWIHTSHSTTQLHVTEIASYKHSALSPPGTSRTACLQHVP